MLQPWLIPIGVVAALIAGQRIWRYLRVRHQVQADEAEELAIEHYELASREWTYHWVALDRFLRKVSLGSAAVVAVVSVALVASAAPPAVRTYVSHRPAIAAAVPAPTVEATPQPAASHAPDTAAATGGTGPAPPPAQHRSAPASAAPPHAAASARPELSHTAAAAVASSPRTASPSPSPGPSLSPTLAGPPEIAPRAP